MSTHAHDDISLTHNSSIPEKFDGSNFKKMAKKMLYWSYCLKLASTLTQPSPSNAFMNLLGLLEWRCLMRKTICHGKSLSCLSVYW